MEFKFVTTVFIGLILTIQGFSQQPINNVSEPLSLSKNGKLLSVDKKEIDFKVSKNEEVSNICFYPFP